ncbi:uncharacterized protein LOC112346531 [Selaginella moellendorffii]|uniref:uncharacterized protein LOC112346531 n=1 Tax=Selaginella moellendorffii TaxID=88036 RepID=UPI000D1C2CA1|nr:uncharacterized protein LOC112346531 [Selaginella moellendorffii]|eukprot:XP_024531455.1 uncharacterized protein LOC112346531 [Selaginella moellendorffii]
MAAICHGCLCSRREMVASICGFGVALNSSCAAAAILPQGPPPAEKNEFVQKLLERSKANKEKNDRERLESYYKRNYTDYFEYIKRTTKNKTLSPTEEKINAWLDKNKNKK